MTQPPTPNPEAAQLAALIADDAFAMSFQSFGQYRSALLKTLASQSRPAADEASERERFELSAIARTWAYRSEHGLRFYPSYDGGGDLWKGWLAAKADMSTPAPQIDASAGCVDSSGWRPIDSAPKVVGRIIGAVDGHARFICWGKASHVPIYGWVLTDQGPEECDLCQPTHWQPLPNLPAESTDGLAKGGVS